MTISQNLPVIGNINTQGREKYLKGSVNLVKSVIQIQKYFQFPRPRFQADAERKKLWRAVKRFMEAPQITKSLPWMACGLL